MSKKIIIAIVGMAGSGKSVSCAHFADLGYPVLRFGDQIDIGLKKLGLPLIQVNEKKYREDIRKELGMAAMAIKIEPHINQAIIQSDTVFLDGLYSWEEFIYLKEKFDHLFLLAIYTRPYLRYQRLSIRKIRPLTALEARNRDFAEIENLHKGGPIAMADFLIKNNKQTGKLFDKLDSTFDLIKNQVNHPPKV